MDSQRVSTASRRAGTRGGRVPLALAALAVLAVAAVLLFGTGAIRASGLEPWAGDSPGSRRSASSAVQPIDPRLILSPRAVAETATAAGVRMDLTTAPLLPGANHFSLSLCEHGRPLSATHVTLVASMDGMPMQPIMLPMREIRPGEYTATGPLTMFGSWQLSLGLDRPGASALSHQFTVSIDLPQGLFLPAGSGAGQ